MRPLLSVFLGLVVRGGIYWRTIKSLSSLTLSLRRILSVLLVFRTLVSFSSFDKSSMARRWNHFRTPTISIGSTRGWGRTGRVGWYRPKLKTTDFLPKTERHAFDLMGSKLGQLQKLHKTLKRIWRRFYLRPHVFPSICSLKVGWQVHWYEPGEFVQLWWHPPLSCDIKERVNWGTGLSKQWCSYLRGWLHFLDFIRKEFSSSQIDQRFLTAESIKLHKGNCGWL